MTKDKKNKIKPKHNPRHSHGVYLVVADRSEEFDFALRYAVRLAELKQDHVGILYVIEPQGFQHWGMIEDKIQKDQRKKAEEHLWRFAHTVRDLDEKMPVFYIEEGRSREAVLKVIEREKDIKRLVLAGNTKGSSPGPLVSYFSGKGLSRLRIPLVIVPNHLDFENVDEIA
jgi:nucleotide-binding universal stress UspA family protein